MAWRGIGAGDGNRTHDIQLGKLDCRQADQAPSCKTLHIGPQRHQRVTAEKQNRTEPPSENKGAAPSGGKGSGRFAHAQRRESSYLALYAGRELLGTIRVIDGQHHASFPGRRRVGVFRTLDEAKNALSAAGGER